MGQRFFRPVVHGIFQHNRVQDFSTEVDFLLMSPQGCMFHQPPGRFIENDVNMIFIGSALHAYIAHIKVMFRLLTTIARAYGHIVVSRMRNFVARAHRRSYFRLSLRFQYKGLELILLMAMVVGFAFPQEFVRSANDPASMMIRAVTQVEDALSRKNDPFRLMLTRTNPEDARPVFYGPKPGLDVPEPFYTMTVVATAYSSTPDQTDGSPFITANGLYVYDGLIAANFLPFGTRVKIPDHYG